MQNEIKPLLTIIIATKNRDIYCFYAAKQILSLPDDNIQLVVQNNSDTNYLEELIAGLMQDKRLKYRYDPEKISSIDNFNRAVSMADGEYVCLLGDDDGINPEIMKIVSWAKMNNISAIKYGLQAGYTWPKTGVISNKQSGDNGVLRITKISCNVSINSTRGELIRLMKDGGQDYLSRNLVKLYHGIVKREFMEKVKDITSNYFGGLSPDIYSAIALSSLIDKVVCMEYPLTIPGVCSKSTSAASVKGEHTGRLEDAPHLLNRHNYSWADEVPKIYSVDTIWADSALASVKDINDIELFNNFNNVLLSAKCLIKYPQYSKVIRKHYDECCKKKKKNIIVAYTAFIYFSFKFISTYLIKGVIRKLSRRKDDYIFINNIENIIEAEKALNTYIQNNKINVDAILKKLNALV